MKATQPQLDALRELLAGAEVAFELRVEQRAGTRALNVRLADRWGVDYSRISVGGNVSNLDHAREAP